MGWEIQWLPSLHFKPTSSLCMLMRIKHFSPCKLSHKCYIKRTTSPIYVQWAVQYKTSHTHTHTHKKCFKLEQLYSRKMFMSCTTPRRLICHWSPSFYNHVFLRNQNKFELVRLPRWNFITKTGIYIRSYFRDYNKGRWQSGTYKLCLHKTYKMADLTSKIINS